jgi:hypothetical protein
MGRTDSSRLLTAAALGIALAYGLLLAQFLLHGQWILDPQGQPIITDFLPVYMAGKLALSGHAATAYDWRAFHGIQAHFVGHPFAGFLGWHYPPLHFLVAMALALLPYPAAFLGWTVLTLAAFAWAVNRIVKGAAVFALALPPVLACALVGQNGFFSAALLGAMLLCLPARPLLAGFVLAALTFKPQFGLLMPFALLAGGYWRTLAVAAVLALAWIGIGLVVSPSSFAGFLHYLPQTGQAVLNEGTSGWGKLQSIYAAVRLFGGNGALAWGAQIAFILAAIGFCVWLWRRDVSFALKAAALSAGVLLATPYVYFYDLPLLAVPLAFLWRDRAFDLAEHIVGGVIFAALAAFTFGPAPWGLVASLLAMALVVRRSV